MNTHPRIECPECELSTVVDESGMCVHCGEILPTYVMDELRSWIRKDKK